jgi:hypothetical protein
MTSEFFPAVNRWVIPTGAIEVSFTEMRADGEVRGTEGIALWLGRRDDDAVITCVVLLRGPGIVREPDFVQISDALMNDVTDEAIRVGAQLVGQVHSHGPLASTNLSKIDQTGGVRVPFYLSAVAADYAAGRPDLASCAVHVFEPSGSWRWMTAAEVTDRIAVVPGTVDVITVGGPA